MSVVSTPSPQQAQRILLIATGVVVVSVAAALAGLTWRIAGHSSSGAIAVQPVSLSGGTAPNIAPALALQPFGQAAMTDVGTATTLPFELKGVFAAADAELAVAYISIGGAPTITVRVGESINGAVVRAIRSDRILLTNGGRDEYLAFPDPSLSAAQRAEEQQANGGTPAAPTAAPLVPGVAPAQGNGPPPPAPPSEASLLQKLDATPTGDGLRIGNNGPAGMIAGDVVQSINGTPLGDPAAARSALASAQSSGSAQVQILRDGKRITLTVPLR